ncbi:pyocin knob domain-containing protein [Atlantibacter hermannii]|uniref:pyocin knob domain-containing protein n=2 Tax=Atlantibacter hermannii TaxID=565 RepID=UPI002FF4A532
MSTGTLKLTSNSTAVVGTSTLFTTDLKPGDFITATIGGVLYTLPVDTVTSNTAATLVSPFTGPTTTGAAWAAVPRKVLNQVTADLVAQSTEALRGLLVEKGVWTNFYTEPGDISVQLSSSMPAVTGPGWQKMAGLVGSSQQVRGALPAAANLNSYGPTAALTGIWMQGTSNNAQPANNFPEANAVGFLEVFAGGQWGGTQRYTVRNGNVYIRSLTASWNGVDGPWGDWNLAGVNSRPGFYTGDLNLLVTPGVWSVTDGTTGTTNGPVAPGQAVISTGICEVILRSSANSLLQRFTTIASGAGNLNRTWQRTLSGTTWSPWEQQGAKVLSDLGLGVSSMSSISSMDWNQFDFVSGQEFSVAASNMTNTPTGIDITGWGSTPVCFNVIGVDGAIVTAECWLSHVTNSLFRRYQVRISGSKGSRIFAVRQIWTSADIVPVANGGTGAATPTGARTALELGTAATRNVGVAQNNVPALGTTITNTTGAYLSYASNGIPNFASITSQARPPLQVANGANNSASAAMSFFRDGVYGVCFGLDALNNQFSFGGYSAGAVSYRFWTEQNTVVDGNGFIKKASPVVKVAGDGSAELNAESAGVTVERLDKGVYRISGVLGFNSDAGWGGVDGGIELPTDKNKLPLVWVDYEVGPDGSILLKTFHRTHPGAPKFARNEINDVADGDPVDIPAGRCIDLRVEMPVNSVWNTEQARLAEEFRAEYERQQREAEQQAVQEGSQNQSVTADREIDS